MMQIMHSFVEPLDVEQFVAEEKHLQQEGKWLFCFSVIMQDHDRIKKKKKDTNYKVMNRP
jgi:hypothetical protein